MAPVAARPKPPDPDDPWFVVLRGIEARLSAIDTRLDGLVGRLDGVVARSETAHDPEDDSNEASRVLSKGIVHNFTVCVKWAQKTADKLLASTYAKVLAGAVVATAVPLVPKVITGLVALIGGK